MRLLPIFILMTVTISYSWNNNLGVVSSDNVDVFSDIEMNRDIIYKLRKTSVVLILSNIKGSSLIDSFIVTNFQSYNTIIGWVVSSNIILLSNIFHNCNIYKPKSNCLLDISIGDNRLDYYFYKDGSYLRKVYSEINGKHTNVKGKLFFCGSIVVAKDDGTNSQYLILYEDKGKLYYDVHAPIELPMVNYNSKVKR